MQTNASAYKKVFSYSINYINDNRRKRIIDDLPNFPKQFFSKHNQLVYLCNGVIYNVFTDINYLQLEHPDVINIDFSDGINKIRDHGYVFFCNKRGFVIYKKYYFKSNMFAIRIACKWTEKNILKFNNDVDFYIKKMKKLEDKFNSIDLENLPLDNKCCVSIWLSESLLDRIIFVSENCSKKIKVPIRLVRKIYKLQDKRFLKDMFSVGKLIILHNSRFKFYGVSTYFNVKSKEGIVFLNYIYQLGKLDELIDILEYNFLKKC